MFDPKNRRREVPEAVTVAVKHLGGDAMPTEDGRPSQTRIRDIDTGAQPPLLSGWSCPPMAYDLPQVDANVKVYQTQNQGLAS